MNQILRAALDHGDTSLIAAGVLAHPRSHQLLQKSVEKVFQFASRQVEPTPADTEMVRAIGRSFLIFDGESA